MKYLIPHRSRWLPLVVLILVVTSASFILSDAFGQKRRGTAATSETIRGAVYVTGGFTFSPPKEMVRPPIPFLPGGAVQLKDQDVEPEIKIDVFGNIYIAAIHGVPGGIDLWKSTDKGANFVYLGEPDGAQDKCGVTGTVPCSAGAGGGDVSLDLSTGGYLYVSSLYLGGVTMSTSMDGGAGGVEPGQAWQVNPAANGNPPVPVNDRQWVASYGPSTVYMTFDQAPAPGPLWFVKSTDAGKTFSVPAMLTGPAGVDRPGNVAVDQYTGTIYTTFEPSTLVGTTRVAVPNQINLLKSTNGGATWTTTTAYVGPAGTTVENAFVILAVDRGGNLHMAFAQSSTAAIRTNCHVYLMSSSDGGATWTTPVQVDAPPPAGSNSSATIPWIVGGSSGVVDVTWYQSSSASPDQAPFDWHCYFAQVTNALSGNPTISQVLATPNQVHNDAICSRGGNCSGSTRDLAEYYTITVDPDGNAHIAFVDGINDCVGPPTSNCYAKTWYTKQTSGNSAYIPVAGPVPATFSQNISLGAPGGEPGLKVDSHNCIFVTAPGNVLFRKSVNNGASFLPNVNPVAAFPLCCGDEDVLPIPQANGARPDPLYFVDLAQLTSINVAKSTDGGKTWFKPGPSGAAGNVDASSDRQWIAYDRGIPTATDFTVYEMDHEAGSEEIRFNALTVTGGTTDGVWSPPSSGMTDPELNLPPTGTFPNTNPGPVFADPVTHVVYGFFCGSTLRTNRANPPFGKLPNLWEAFGNAPAAAGLPPGNVNPTTGEIEMTNRAVFKGVQDSPTLLPSPAPTPDPAAKTYGNNCANDFPTAAIDSGGNIYVVWAMNNARTDEYMVWFASSHDHGQTFYGPFQVSKGPGAAVMPWIDAGDTGRVDIVYYATTTPVDPNIAPNTVSWNTMFAQSFNANSREPAFTISQVSDHISHTGPICNMGLLCPSGTRTLADFFQVAIGPDGLANISFADNGLTSLHTEFARQTSGPLARTNPSSPTCLAPSINPIGAVSRKTHAGVNFDVTLPITGSPGIECRSGGPSGNHKVIVTFPGAVSVNGTPKASVTSGTGSVSNVTVNGANVTIDLTGVANAQRLVITLNSVSDGTNIGDAQVVMGVLLGDTTANGAVNSSDIAQTQSQSGQLVTLGNFREDVTVNGAINSSDIALVQSKSGTALPAP